MDTISFFKETEVYFICMNCKGDLSHECRKTEKTELRKISHLDVLAPTDPESRYDVLSMLSAHQHQGLEHLVKVMEVSLLVL